MVTEISSSVKSRVRYRKGDEPLIDGGEGGDRASETAVTVTAAVTTVVTAAMTVVWRKPRRKRKAPEDAQKRD